MPFDNQHAETFLYMQEYIVSELIKLMNSDETVLEELKYTMIDE